MRTFLVAILLFAASSANAQQVAPKFIRENSPVIALTHDPLIDRTGAALPLSREESHAGANREPRGRRYT
jgi:hypothetical protein